MEVLFITHKFPPSIGGMEKQSFELIQGMSKISKVHTIAYAGKGSKLLFLLSLLWKVKSILYKHPEINCIHLNDGTMAVACWWLKFLTKVPVSVTFHGLDVVFPNRIYQNIILPQIKKFDAFIAVSKNTAKELYNRGFRREKVFVVHNGVDQKIADIPLDKSFVTKFEDQYGLSLSSKKILVMMGRPVKRKGFSWFIKEVFPLLGEDYVLICLGPFNTGLSLTDRLILSLPKSWQRQINLLFGRPDDMMDIRKHLEISNTSNPVIIPGKTEFEKLVQFLSISHLFLMPNIRVPGDIEGFGLVSLEANLRSLPVLASDLEGIRDAIYPTHNGWLLPPVNAKIWASKIIELFQTPGELNEAGEKAKKYTLDQFSWEKMVNEYYRIFKEVQRTFSPSLKLSPEIPLK